MTTSIICFFTVLLNLFWIQLLHIQVEQLHKIFKLCGSPPEEYWKKTRLPHATLFKPQQPYDSCLRETFKDFHASSVNLLQTLLSVEPSKRGTASSALSLEVHGSVEPSKLFFLQWLIAIAEPLSILILIIFLFWDLFNAYKSVWFYDISPSLLGTNLFIIHLQTLWLGEALM